MKALQGIVLACLSTLLFFHGAGALTLYDSNGFESFAAGDLNGQHGWTAYAGGDGTAPQVVTTPPVLGTKAVLLEVSDNQGSASEMDHSIPPVDLSTKPTITVSFDIYRQVSTTTAPWPQNLWWWWYEAGEPTYGLQWDAAGGPPQTLPHGWNPGATNAATIFNQYANLTMVWDFSTLLAYSLYNGVPVDNGIPITGITSLTGWAIHFSHDSDTGTGADRAWIDNFVITSTTTTPIPEPCTMLLLGSGLVGVAGLRRRFKR